VRWREIFDYIGSRDPGYAGTIAGISREDIARCEALCGVTLPGIYRDFLAAMGDECGVFEPFGAGQACDFATLVEQLPVTGYPGERYFKVACETSPAAVTLYDQFIDLGRSDSEDAPLVMFEDVGEFAPTNVQELGVTVGEKLAGRAFDHFDLAPRGRSRVVSLVLDRAADATRWVDAVQMVLQRGGLVPAMPATARASWWRNDTVSAWLAVREKLRLFTVTLGVDEGRAGKVLVEQIVERLPGARVRG